MLIINLIVATILVRDAIVQRGKAGIKYNGFIAGNDETSTITIRAIRAKYVIHNDVEIIINGLIVHFLKIMAKPSAKYDIRPAANMKNATFL